jgi:hypothetical protein
MKSSHQKTYEMVRQCLEKTNKENREEVADQLKQLQGKLAQLRYFLFTQPYSITLISIVIVIFFLFIAFIINILEGNIFIRFAFIIIYAIFALTIPIYLDMLTPKVKVELDERWKEVLDKYLTVTTLQNDMNKAKQNFKRAILYYSEEGKPVNFLVNLLWGGIIIGCLPDPAFQKALITFSPSIIWNANPLGSIGLICLPFIYTYYYVRYDLPIAWLENILAQIELKE